MFIRQKEKTIGKEVIYGAVDGRPFKLDVRDIDF